jgi:hypothetical protein
MIALTQRSSCSTVGNPRRFPAYVKAGPNSSSGSVAEHATNYEYAHPPFSDHQTKDSLPPYVTDESEGAQVRAQCLTVKAALLLRVAGFPKH